MSNEWGGGLVKRCDRVLLLVVVVGATVVGFVWSPAAAQQATQVRFAESSLQVVENRTQLRVLVERVDLPVSRLLVHYRTENVAGSAESGHDYAHTAGTLVFDVGVRSNAFTVWVRNDDVPEETEHLLLHLETSSGTGASSRLTILDDDLPPAPVEAPSTAAPKVAGVAASGAAGSPASGAVVVAASAGSSRPVAVAPPRQVRARSSARVAQPRRITLKQTPTTPFELRPTGGTEADAGGMTTVDPLLALGGGLLLARVGAEVWFRTRIAFS